MRPPRYSSEPRRAHPRDLASASTLSVARRRRRACAARLCRPPRLRVWSMRSERGPTCRITSTRSPTPLSSHWPPHAAAMAGAQRRIVRSSVPGGIPLARIPASPQLRAEARTQPALLSPLRCGRSACQPIRPAGSRRSCLPDPVLGASRRGPRPLHVGPAASNLSRHVLTAGLVRVVRRRGLSPWLIMAFLSGRSRRTPQPDAARRVGRRRLGVLCATVSGSDRLRVGVGAAGLMCARRRSRHLVAERKHTSSSARLDVVGARQPPFADPVAHVQLATESISTTARVYARRRCRLSDGPCGFPR